MGPLFTRDGDGDGRNRSRFYHPHLVHDTKTHSLATVSLLSDTHSDRLAARVTDKETEERALRLKTGFYDQFLPAGGSGSGPHPCSPR